MDLHLTLLRVVLVMFVMIAVAHGLRRGGFFKDDHGAVFTNLVFKLTVPALIVHALATHPLERTVLDLTLLSGEVGVAGMLVGWLAGFLLRFDTATIGVLVLAGGFGNTVVRSVGHRQQSSLPLAQPASHRGEPKPGRSGTFLFPTSCGIRFPSGTRWAYTPCATCVEMRAYHLVALPFGVTAHFRRERPVSYGLLPAIGCAA